MKFAVICMTHFIGILIGFHLLLKKAESSYDNTSYKSNLSFINHSNCEVTDFMSTNSKNDMWTEITNICRLRSQNCKNATSLEVYAGIKQAYSQVFMFGEQNKLLGGKNCFYYGVYMLETNFSGHNKICGHGKFMDTALNAPMSTSLE